MLGARVTRGWCSIVVERPLGGGVVPPLRVEAHGDVRGAVAARLHQQRQVCALEHAHHLRARRGREREGQRRAGRRAVSTDAHPASAPSGKPYGVFFTRRAVVSPVSGSTSRRQISPLKLPKTPSGMKQPVTGRVQAGPGRVRRAFASTSPARRKRLLAQRRRGVAQQAPAALLRARQRAEHRARAVPRACGDGLVGVGEIRGCGAHAVRHDALRVHAVDERARADERVGAKVLGGVRLAAVRRRAHRRLVHPLQQRVHLVLHHVAGGDDGVRDPPAAPPAALERYAGDACGILIAALVICALPSAVLHVQRSSGCAPSPPRRRPTGRFPARASRRAPGRAPGPGTTRARCRRLCSSPQHWSALSRPRRQPRAGSAPSARRSPSGRSVDRFAFA